MRNLPLLLLLCAACAQPELTRRYKSLAEPERRDDLVNLSVFVLEPEEPSRRLVDQLDEKSRATLVNALATKGSVDGVVDLLLRRVEPFSHNSVIDKTRFQRRLILAIAKDLRNREVSPADRIAELEVDLTLKDDEAQFISWDKFATETQEVDLGKITLAQTRKFELGAKIGPKAGSSNPVELTPKYTGERKLTEEVSLKQRYVVISGTLTRQSAKIYQQGVVGIDLTGNAILDLEVRVRAARELIQVFQPRVIGSDGEWLDPADAGLYIGYLRYPASPRSVLASTDGWYSLRSVKREDRTVVEGDDSVVYRRGTPSGAGEFVLVDDREMKTSCWVLGGVRARKGKKPRFHLLQVTDMGPAFFASFEAADRLLSWLRVKREPGKALTVGKYGFTLAGAPLKAEDFGLLTIGVRPLNFSHKRMESDPEKGVRVTEEDATTFEDSD